MNLQQESFSAEANRKKLKASAEQETSSVQMFSSGQSKIDHIHKVKIVLFFFGSVLVVVQFSSLSHV